VQESKYTVNRPYIHLAVCHRRCDEFVSGAKLISPAGCLIAVQLVCQVVCIIGMQDGVAAAFDGPKNGITCAAG